MTRGRRDRIAALEIYNGEECPAAQRLTAPESAPMPVKLFKTTAARRTRLTPAAAGRTQATTLVGAMLREQRRRLNLTLQEVADRAGITKGFLSEVERDRAAPSVATLLKLRDCLSLSVSSLFRSSLPQVVRHNERQDIPYGGLGMICSLASARNAHRLTALHAEFKPLGLSGFGSARIGLRRGIHPGSWPARSR